MLVYDQGARLRANQEDRQSGDDNDDDSSDESIDEELGFLSPLENVDPYLTFKHALTCTFCLPTPLSYRLGRL